MNKATKIMTGIGLAAVLTLGTPALAVQAAPAPAPSISHGVNVNPDWYLNKTGCKYPYYAVLQHYWWNWFQTRSVCQSSTDQAPLFYW